MKKFIMILAFLSSQTSFAHRPSDAFLTLKKAKTQLTGSWDIALKDLEFALGVDQNLDGKITWGEVQNSSEQIAGYASAHLKFSSAEGDCGLSTGSMLVNQRNDGGYASIPFSVQCPKEAELITVKYDLLFDLDSQHRGLLYYSAKHVTKTFVFSSTRMLIPSPPLSLPPRSYPPQQ